MTPAPKRAGAAKAAMDRVTGNRPPADPGEQPNQDQVAAAPKAEPKAEPKPPVNPDRSKFTVLLTESDAILWDELAMALRRDLGRRVDKSAFLRALVYLATEDADLRRQVGEQITRDTTA